MNFTAAGKLLNY